MLLGVLATYAIEPKGRAVYIFTGVAILFGAVIMNTVASTWVHELLFKSSLNNKRKQKPENKALLENDESKTSETAVEVQEEAPKPYQTNIWITGRIRCVCSLFLESLVQSLISSMDHVLL